jgi:hypothetical protein
MGADQLGHLIAKLAHPLPVAGITQIENGAHMQGAAACLPVNGTPDAMSFEQGLQVCAVCGKIMNWDSTIFDQRQGLRR